MSSLDAGAPYDWSLFVSVQELAFRTRQRADLISRAAGHERQPRLAVALQDLEYWLAEPRLDSDAHAKYALTAITAEIDFALAECGPRLRGSVPNLQSLEEVLCVDQLIARQSRRLTCDELLRAVQRDFGEAASAEAAFDDLLGAVADRSTCSVVVAARLQALETTLAFAGEGAPTLQELAAILGGEADLQQDRGNSGDAPLLPSLQPRIDACRGLLHTGAPATADRDSTASHNSSVEGALVQSARVHYRKVLAEVAWITFAAGLIILAAQMAVNPGVRPWDLEQAGLDPAFSMADATVVVIGVLTVVAALSIALFAGSQQSTSVQPVDDYAAQVVWASLTVVLSNATSGASLSVAIMQFFQTGDARRPIQAAFLVAIALFTVALSAAVRNWPGRRALLQATRQARLQRVREQQRVWRCVRPARAWVPYGGFVLGGSLLTVMLHLVERVSFGSTPSTARQWQQIGELYLLCCGFIWTTVVATRGRWKADVESSRAARLLAKAPILSFGLVGTFFYILLGLLRPSVEAWVYAGTLFAGTIAIPGLLLAEARGRERWPVTFIAQRHARWLLRQEQQALERVATGVL